MLACSHRVNAARVPQVEKEGRRKREGGLFSGSTTSTNGMCSALLSVGWMRWCVPLEGVIKPHLRLAHGVDPCPITSLFFLSFRISIFNTFPFIFVYDADPQLSAEWESRNEEALSFVPVIPHGQKNSDPDWSGNTKILSWSQFLT